VWLKPVLWVAGILLIGNALRLLAYGLAGTGWFDYGPQTLPLIDIGMTMFLLLFTIPAAVLVVVGLRAQKSGEYPPRGARRANRTPLQGDEAVRKGKMLVRLGIAAIVLALVSVLINRSMNRSFLQNPFGFVPKKAMDKMHEEIGRQ
jgi:hypothetical protein